MADIAQLGFEIDSTPAAAAAVNLDKMTAAGKRAESGVQKILAAINKQTAEVQKLNSQLGNNASNAERMAQSHTRAARAVRETGDAAARAGGSFGSAATMVRGFITAVASIQTVRTLIGLADQAANLDARLRLVTDSQREFSAAQEVTFAIAQRTSSSLASTVTLYSRMAQATRDLNLSQGELAQLTQTINKAFVVSGSTVQEATNAIIQLSQGLAAGALRGEEFNSVNEQGPRIMQALADSLGVTRGELRAMAMDGKLTTQVILDALKGQAAAIDEEFSAIPLTVERAWTQLQNAVLRYVGDADKANGASRQLAEGVKYVADNFDKFVPIIGAVLAALTAYLALSSPLGLMVTGIAALVAVYLDWADTSEHVSEANRKLVASVDAVTAATDSGSAASAAAMADLYAETQARLQLAKAALAEAQAKIAAQGGLWVSNEQAQALRQAAADVEALTGATDQLEQSFGNAAINGVRDFLSSLFEVQSSTGDLNTLMAQWRQGVSEAEKKVREHTEGTAAYRKELADLIVTKAIDAGQTEAQIAALREELAEGAKILQQADDIKNARRDAAAARREESAADREAAKAARELEALAVAQARWHAEVQGLRAELAGPMAEAAWDHASAVEAMRDAYHSGEMTLGDYVTGMALLDEKLAETNAGLEKQRDIVGRIKAEHQAEAKALGLSGRQLFIYEELRRASAEALEQHNRKLRDTAALSAAEAEAIRESAAALYDQGKAAANLGEILSEFGGDKSDSPILQMVSDLETLQKELDRVSDASSEAFDPERAAELTRAIERMSTKLEVDTVGGFKALLGAAQAFQKEGSSGFEAMEAGMAALSIIQDVIALKAAVTAVLTQGEGDPYSAWARMAAMAAAVAPFLASIGVTLSSFGGGGGGPTTAEDRQATQGTGTVLGDAEAKSESILNATQITADATSELVGINRGMLNALLALQDGITGATTMLARGAGAVEFGSFDPGTMLNARNGAAMGAAIGSVIPIIGTAIGMVVGAALGHLLRGSSRLSDQGIAIGGGPLEDMSFQAYQEHQVRSWRFGSRRDVEQRADLPEDVANQFNLVIDSIVETVREAALALGLLPAEIEAALATYEQEEIRISLMDLSAEEQQAELEAVFSSIFDGLAGHVVPFIAQFQRVGEGLGETLVRVATSVQVVQESMRYLGLVIDETDPEKFAQISVGLIDAAGGIEAFITNMLAFADKFAPESFKFEAAQSALTEAFADAGLAIPATREAMWALMQSLDATTEEGRAQIAMLLEMTDAADAYYSALEDGGRALIDSMTSLAAIMTAVDMALEEAAGGAVVDWQQAMVDLEARNDKLVQTAIEAGASEAELARIREFGAMRARELLEAERAAVAAYDDFIAGFSDASPFEKRIRDIQREEREAVATAHRLARAAGMQGAAERDLAQIHAWAARQTRAAILQLKQSIFDLWDQLSSGGRFVPGQGYVEEAVNDFRDGAVGAINDIAAAQRQLYQQQLAAIQSIRDYLVSMQFGELSALSPMQQLEAARQQLEVLALAAQAGDADAMAQLPGASQQYLQLLADAFASGDEFAAGYEWVRDLLQGIVDAGPTVEDPGEQEPGESGVWDGYPGLTPESMRERDQLLAEQEALYRQQLAQQLVEHLGELSRAVNTPVLQLMEQMGIPLRQLAEDLGADLEHLTGESVRVLADMALALGIPLGELVRGLDLQLPALAAGIRELADELGYNVNELVNETGTGLYNMAVALGVDLEDLAVALGQDLGKLTDVNSPIYQALTGELSKLPDDQADALRQYLEAITTATTEADASAATEAMEAHINTLPADIRAQLAPFFEGVMAPGAPTEIGYLRDIDRAMEDANGWLAKIESNTRAATPTAAGATAYAMGGMINSPTYAMMGEAGRELVLPNAVTEFFAREGIPLNVSGGGLSGSDIAALRADLAEVRAAIAAADRNNVETQKSEGRSNRSNREDVARRRESTARSIR